MQNSQILSCSLLVSTTLKIKFSILVNLFMNSIVRYYTICATTLKVKFSVIILNIIVHEHRMLTYIIEVFMGGP